MGINPQILSNSLDRGLDRNLRRQQYADQKDERAFQRERQVTSDARQADEFAFQRGRQETADTRNTTLFDQQQKAFGDAERNKQILQHAGVADYLLGNVEAGKQLSTDEAKALNESQQWLGNFQANLRAGDGMPRSFAGWKPVGGGRYAAELDVQNSDGSVYRAPVTENGSTDPNDKVKTYSIGDMRQNLKSMVAMARIHAGDNSPIAERKAAAELKDRRAREDKLTGDSRAFSLKTLGIQNDNQLNRMGIQHGYNMENMGVQNQFSRDNAEFKKTLEGKGVGKKTKGAWDSKKVSDYALKATRAALQMDNPNIPFSTDMGSQLTAISSLAESIMNQQLNEVGDVNGAAAIQQAAKQVLDKTKYDALFADPKGESGQGFFGDDDSKTLTFVRDNLPVDATPKQREKFMQSQGIDEDSRRYVHKALSSKPQQPVKPAKASEQNSMLNEQWGASGVDGAGGTAATIRLSDFTEDEFIDQVVKGGIGTAEQARAEYRKEVGGPTYAARPAVLPRYDNAPEFRKAIESGWVKTWAKRGLPVATWLDETAGDFTARERQMVAKLKQQLDKAGLLK